VRVLHSPSNIGGQITILVKELRNLGVACVGMQFRVRKLGFRTDVNLDDGNPNPAIWYWRRFKFFLHSIGYFDIFHFHYGLSFFFLHLDLIILKLLKKKIIFHFHGSDIRNLNYVKELINDTNPKIPKSTFKQKINLWIIKKFSNKILVSTPDLLELVGDEAILLPNTVDLEYWKKPNRKIKNNKLRIIHAPSRRFLKGTEVILKAIQDLKKRENVKFSLIEGEDFDKVKNLYQNADIAIDQLLIGWYGIFAIECMALGIPVVANIREDLKVSFFPELPVIHATKKTLPLVLSKLVEDQDLRKDVGRKGKQFVENYHDSSKVAKKLLDIYD